MATFGEESYDFWKLEMIFNQTNTYIDILMPLKNTENTDMFFCVSVHQWQYIKSFLFKIYNRKRNSLRKE